MYGELTKENAESQINAMTVQLLTFANDSDVVISFKIVEIFLFGLILFYKVGNDFPYL